MTTTAHYPSLSGVPVIVSGGASGIGEALVRNFAAQGAKVGFVDIMVDRGEKLAEELASAGQVARFAACDVTDIAAYQSAIAEFAASHGECIGAGQQRGPRRAP